ncbi:MAG: hypothetical protein RLY14_2015, partial [Planctomycetota bacterium]
MIDRFRSEILMPYCLLGMQGVDGTGNHFGGAIHFFFRGLP